MDPQDGLGTEGFLGPALAVIGIQRHNQTMEFLDWTLDTPAENLALDEALLDWAESRAMGTTGGKGAAEQDGIPDTSVDGERFPCDEPIEWLRLWEPSQPFVVLGRSSRTEEEVDLTACDQANLPIVRRASGGAAVVAGPGCLMYSLVLSLSRRPHLRAIPQVHQFVLEQHVAALGPHGFPARMAGTSDLAFGEPPRKFSGNSLRCKRMYLLYHGTLLYNFDLSLIARYLHAPPRQPDYRNGRGHASFVANLPMRGTDLRQAIAAAWHPRQGVASWPGQSTGTSQVPLGALVRITNNLVEERYSTDAWTFCFR